VAQDFHSVLEQHRTVCCPQSIRVVQSNLNHSRTCLSMQTLNVDSKSPRRKRERE
jgi:hypothetical protein